MRSAGNVFRDVGFPRSEAEQLKIRADLVIALQSAIRSRGLSLARASKKLRVRPSRLRALMRGRIEMFSVDSLLDLLSGLGLTVDVVVRKSGARSTPA